MTTATTAAAEAAVTTAPPPETRAAPVPPTDAATVERARADGILTSASKLGVPLEFARGLVVNGIALDEARQRLIDESHRLHQGTSVTSATILADHTDPSAIRGRMADALAHRLSHGKVALPDHAREFAGCSLLDFARGLMTARGERLTLATADVAGALFRTGAMHTGSDFPLLLAAAVNKSLLQRWTELRPALTAVARRTTTPDYKPIKRLRIGEGGGLEPLDEHGEITRATMGEAGETYAVVPWARAWALTRRAIVNDDLAAFQDFLGTISRKASVLLGDVLHAALTSDAPMSDGIPLFDARHGNLAATTAAPIGDAVAEAFRAMRRQRGVDGGLIEVAPRFLVVGPAQEYRGLQLLTEIDAVVTGDTNPFASRLELVVEPRIEDDSWYLFSEPGAAPVLEYAELDGSRAMGGTGPNVTTRMGFDVPGVEVKVEYDVGAGVVAYQGAYKNPGA